MNSKKNISDMEKKIEWEMTMDKVYFTKHVSNWVTQDGTRVELFRNKSAGMLALFCIDGGGKVEIPMSMVSGMFERMVKSQKYVVDDEYEQTLRLCDHICEFYGCELIKITGYSKMGVVSLTREERAQKVKDGLLDH